MSQELKLRHEFAPSAPLERPSILRIWVLTNAPSPYQVELLNEAAMRGDLELSVRFMRSGSPSGRADDDAPNYDSRVMWGVLPQWARDEVRLHPRAIREVACGGHSVHVLSGLCTSPTFALCALVAVVMRRKYVIWLERPRSAKAGTNLHTRWIPRLIHSIKRRYLQWLLRHAAGVWCIGSQAEQEYQAMGADPDTTRVLPYCCRTDRFDGVRVIQNDLKSQHGLNGRFVFLFSGQLIRRKGVDVLLSAFAAVAQQHPEAVLLLLGDGALRAEYRQQARQLGVESQVRFLGHRPQSELPDWYGLADVFVFPSRHDGWAVVINEACAAGLPIIASAQTGAARDLVDAGINGFVLDCEDVEGWAARIKWCLEHRDQLAAMGEASRHQIEPFSSVSGAARLVQFTNELLVVEQATNCPTEAT